MNIRTNGLAVRVVAVLMLAVVLFGVFSVSHQGMLKGASFAPVVTAKADDIFDDVVKKDDSGNISIQAPNVTDGEKFEPGDIVGKAKGIAQIVLGVATVISLAMLIVNIARMAISSNNDVNRKKAQTAIMWSGIALAGFGGLTAIVSFFWNFLKSVT